MILRLLHKILKTVCCLILFYYIIMGWNFYSIFYTPANALFVNNTDNIVKIVIVKICLIIIIIVILYIDKTHLDKCTPIVYILVIMFFVKHVHSILLLQEYCDFGFFSVHNEKSYIRKESLYNAMIMNNFERLTEAQVRDVNIQYKADEFLHKCNIYDIFRFGVETLEFLDKTELPAELTLPIPIRPENLNKLMYILAFLELLNIFLFLLLLFYVLKFIFWVFRE